ncbi:hypothetical protein PAUR_b0379 [Pseudoalteromonas aurantia 208]|uniref:Uncharacterized protein n=1 Tax=Pseudoalteromonas aurantia 208 TaxID=1314867 RepID=A0ABR9EHA3_9GAMM|nr:hypothetical protein [Pseudoalteromonas aurantia 208]
MDEKYHITEVEVKNDQVWFKTNQKRSALTSCSRLELMDQWLIDLNSKGSANLLSLVLGAFDSQLGLNIVGSGRCATGTELEIVEKITVAR